MLTTTVSARKKHLACKPGKSINTRLTCPHSQRLGRIIQPPWGGARSSGIASQSTRLIDMALGAPYFAGAVPSPSQTMQRPPRRPALAVRKRGHIDLLPKITTVLAAAAAGVLAPAWLRAR
jgi:hypothetical protein